MEGDKELTSGTGDDQVSGGPCGKMTQDMYSGMETGYTQVGR